MNSPQRLLGYSLLIGLLNLIKFGLGVGLALAMRPQLIQANEAIGLMALIFPFIATLWADVKNIIYLPYRAGQTIALGNTTTKWILDYAKYFLFILFPLMIVGAIYDLTQATSGLKWFEEQIFWPVLVNALAQTTFVALVLLPIELAKKR